MEWVTVAAVATMEWVTVAAVAALEWMAVAGFGSAALLHAKLVNINVSQGREVALGPEIIVQTFLNVIDQELDRARAKIRFDSVHELMEGIDFEKAKTRLTSQIYQAMQQITEEQVQVVMERVREIDQTSNLDSQDRSYLLGFVLLDLVGEKFLREIVPRYRSDFLKIAPIGTRPHALGAVLFLLSSERRVELVYDHPIRRASGTTCSANLLVYDVSQFQLALT